MNPSATETVGSPEALLSVLSSIQKVVPDATVETDVEAGRAMSFELANGTATSAFLLFWMQTPHGSAYVIESTSVPMFAQHQRSSVAPHDQRFATCIMT